MSDYVNTIISVKKEHKEWLKKHPEINFSGFVRVKLEELINGDNPIVRVKRGKSKKKRD